MDRAGLAAATLLAVLVAAPAWGLDVRAGTAEVGFHISHPAKEYDAHLLPGGADVVGRFDPADLGRTEGEVTIRVASFNSDNVRRDSHMMESLEGLLYPEITWTVRGLAGVSGPIRPGTYEAKAAGPLSLHGVKLDLVVPVTLVVGEDGTIEVTSRFTIKLSDYGVERATLVFVPIADEVPITVRMVFPAGPDVLYSEPAPAPPPVGEVEGRDETPEATP